MMVVQQEISFSEIKDPGVTGNFEIKVNGALVHSKKTQGRGGGAQPLWFAGLERLHQVMDFCTTAMPRSRQLSSRLA